MQRSVIKRLVAVESQTDRAIYRAVEYLFDTDRAAHDELYTWWQRWHADHHYQPTAPQFAAGERYQELFNQFMRQP